MALNDCVSKLSEFCQNLECIVVLIAIEVFGVHVCLLVELTSQVIVAHIFICRCALQLRNEYLFVLMRECLEFEYQALLIHLNCIITIPFDLCDNSDIPADLRNDQVVHG